MKAVSDRKGDMPLVIKMEEGFMSQRLQRMLL